MKDMIYPHNRLYAVMVFMLLACFYCKGQGSSQSDFISDPAYIDPVLIKKTDPNLLKIPEIRKVSFSISTGMIIGTAGSENNFATGYISPAFAYNIGNRLRIRAGSLILLNSFHTYPDASSQPGIFSSRSLNQFALFVAADYFVTDRFVITGTAYKMQKNDLIHREITPEVMNRYQTLYYIPSESMSVGLHYNIAKGFTIGAEVRFSNHYQPALSPYPQYDSVYW